MYRMCGESGESSPSPSALCSSEEERGGDRDDGGGCHKDGRSDGARRPEDRQVGRERDSGGKGSRMRCRDDSAGSRDSFYDDARPESEDDIRGGGVPQKERDGRHTRRDRNTDARSEGRKKLCGKPEDSELLPDIRGQGDDQEAADSFRDLHPDARTEEAEQKAEDCDRALDVPHARSEAHPPQDEKPAENEERKPRESHQDPHPKDKKQPAKSQDERPPDAGSQAAEKRRTRRHSLDREIPPVKSPSDLCPDGSKAQSGPPDKNAEEGHPSGRSQDGNKHLGLRSDSSKGHVAPDEQKAISAEAKKRPHCDLDLRDGDRDAPGEAERKPACRRRDSGMRAKETFKDDLPERRPDTGKEGSGGKHLDPHPGATSDNEARDQDEAAGPGRPGNRDQNASGRHAEEESGNEGDASTLSRMDAGVRPSPGGVVARVRQSDTLLATASDGSALLPDGLSQLRLSEAENHHAGVLSDSMEGVSLSTCMTRSRSESDFCAKPKSFIRPLMTQQTIKKMDPVARYFHYKQLWDQLKLPGERDHRELRWEIRERLTYRPPAPKARRSLAANDYVVPTDKKRSALRWEVRSLMAHPHLPHRFPCRF